MATQPSSGIGREPRKSGNGAGRGSAAQSGENVIPIPRTGSAQDIHRPPPHSVEAEQGILSSMLISPRDAIAEVVDRVTPEHFYVPSHSSIFQVLLDLYGARKPIDMITFTQELNDRGLLATIGGPAFVAHLQTFVPTAANLQFY